MSNDLCKKYRETTHYMEKMRAMIARDLVGEWNSVFVSFAKEVEKRMKEIIKELETK